MHSGLNPCKKSSLVGLGVPLLGHRRRLIRVPAPDEVVAEVEDALQVAPRRPGPLRGVPGPERLHVGDAAAQQPREEAPGGARHLVGLVGPRRAGPPATGSGAWGPSQRQCVGSDGGGGSAGPWGTTA